MRYFICFASFQKAWQHSQFPAHSKNIDTTFLHSKTARKSLVHELQSFWSGTHRLVYLPCLSMNVFYMFIHRVRDPVVEYSLCKRYFRAHYPFEWCQKRLEKLYMLLPCLAFTILGKSMGVIHSASWWPAPNCNILCACTAMWPKSY